MAILSASFLDGKQRSNLAAGYYSLCESLIKRITNFVSFGLVGHKPVVVFMTFSFLCFLISFVRVLKYVLLLFPVDK